MQYRIQTNRPETKGPPAQKQEALFGTRSCI